MDGQGRQELVGIRRHERVVRFAEEVGAQAFGTVTGAGLLYLFAGWFGMMQPPPGRVVIAVLVIAGLPVAAVAGLRRRPGQRTTSEGTHHAE